MHLTPVVDVHQRPLGVLRLSLTARCNLSCPYCCPDSSDRPGLLNLEEQLRLIRVACRLGAHTLRLTGGEPLLSSQLLPLLQNVFEARRLQGDPMQGLREVALTTNGVLLTQQMGRQLKTAGLDRITISLDAVEGAVAAKMTGLQGGSVAGDRYVQKVLAGVETAKTSGFTPSVGALKLNAVIQRGVNDHQLRPLAHLARQHGLELRLIEFMDVGNRNGWTKDQVVPAAEMVQRIGAVWPLQSLGRDVGGTAQRWRYADGGGVLGVIASISEPFCGDCNRLRVTADGQAFSCLFASEGTDLSPHIHSDVALQAVIQNLWRQRNDRYSEHRRDLAPRASLAEMAYLGG